MMSGSIAPVVTMDSGPASHNAVGPMRKLANGRQSPTSPLKLFGQAKKKINDIFVEIASYVNESGEFLTGANQSGKDLVTNDDAEKIQSFTGKVEGIREILARDRMKVAFFGRTSNGKSTVINAMLKGKILPSGIGHTTHCFLQVEGTDSQEAYLRTEGSDIRRNIKDISQLASALSNVKLDCDKLVTICWPKDQCNLLRDDVVLVDSPGIDVSPNIDEWIDKHCLDADVFVLVANAESTLMQTEKNFFHKVSSKLSKPNIFILNNRWDCSASEPEMMEEVKKQHLERTIQFLVDEIDVMDRFQAEDRVFFVSAREALVLRASPDTHRTPTPSQNLLEGYQGRIFEFASFERKFEECISKSAVQTKFAQHTTNGKELTSEVRTIMDEVYSAAINKRDEKHQTHAETRDRLDYIEKQLLLLSDDIKEKIKLMVEEVERKVSTALVEEIRRLSALVDEFDRPFHPDQMLLNIYKKELHAHIEKAVGRNLQNRCSTAVKTGVEGAEQEMEERLMALLPVDSQQQTANVLPTRDFEVAYRLDCRNLCADFQEDIEFRFSLGITSMIQRFLGPRGKKALLSGGSNTIPRPIPQTPQTPSNENIAPENEVMIAMLGTFTSLYSRSTVGALAITGLVAKSAGWRILAICGVFYGTIYLYERLTWTTKARERAFKRQYVDYASSKLKLIVDLTSANCSHQVQHLSTFHIQDEPSAALARLSDMIQAELASTFARLCHQVDVAKSDLQEDLKKLKGDIDELESAATRASFLRNKAGYLDTELNTFLKQYLNPESRL